MHEAPVPPSCPELLDELDELDEPLELDELDELLELLELEELEALAVATALEVEELALEPLLRTPDVPDDVVLKLLVALTAEVLLVTLLPLPEEPLLPLVMLAVLELEWLLAAPLLEAVTERLVDESPEPPLDVALAVEWPPPLELAEELCDDPPLLLVVCFDEPEADADDAPDGAPVAVQVPARQAYPATQSLSREHENVWEPAPMPIGQPVAVSATSSAMERNSLSPRNLTQTA